MFIHLPLVQLRFVGLSEQAQNTNSCKTVLSTSNAAYFSLDMSILFTYNGRFEMSTSIRALTK